jgi:hypothetical protein
VKRLRDIWRFLCEALSGRLLARLRNVELNYAWQCEANERWLQEVTNLRGTTTQDTQRLTRELRGVHASIHALAVRTADERLGTVERALTFDDEITPVVIVRDADSKT